MNKKIFITGVGCFSPFGAGYNTLINGLYSGKRPFHDYENDYIKTCPVKLGAFSREGLDMYRNNYLTETLFEIALEEALASSKLSNLDKDCKMIIGTGSTGMEMYEQFMFYNKHYNYDFIKGILNDSIKNIQNKFGLNIPYSILTTACSSTNYALGQAMMNIKLGKAKKIILCGFDIMSIIPMCGFNRINGFDPEGLRPFTNERCGTNYGEGSAVLIIEDEESVNLRGAVPLAEVVGYGFSCDGYDQTIPEPTGLQASNAMQRALKRAQLFPSDISCLFVHGTGTKLNDIFEYNAIYNVFKDLTGKIPITAPKSILAHAGGTANILAFCAAIDSLKNNRIFATLNVEGGKNDFPIDLVLKNRKITCDNVMINGFAFGGNNAITILKKV